MASDHSQLMARARDSLTKAGWTFLCDTDAVASLPDSLLGRYNSLPDDLLYFVTHTRRAISPSKTSWFLGVQDFRGETDLAFAWNEWELLMLGAAQADNDRAWAERIRQFWDRHFPVLMSVKNGYAYVAYDVAASVFVVGEEPEFEDVAPAAASLFELLEHVCHPEGTPLELLI